VAGLMQSHAPVGSTMIPSTGRQKVRLAYGEAIVKVGAVAVAAAGIVLLVRLTKRAEARKEMRENAVATLTESGEFFFAADQIEPTTAPIGDA
jgi:uncharacterized membrane protein